MVTVQLGHVLFVAPLVISAITLAALHWFPWNRGAKPLSRPQAYTMGTLITVGVPVVAMLLAVGLNAPQGELFWAMLLVSNALVSGAAVRLCYWIDDSATITLEDAANERR